MIYIIHYYVYYVFELHVTCSVHLNILAGSNLGGAFKEMEMIALKKKTIVFSLQCNLSAGGENVYKRTDCVHVCVCVCECVCACVCASVWCGCNNLFTFAARVGGDCLSLVVAPAAAAAARKSRVVGKDGGAKSCNLFQEVSLLHISSRVHPANYFYFFLFCFSSSTSSPPTKPLFLL